MSAHWNGLGMAAGIPIICRHRTIDSCNFSHIDPSLLLPPINHCGRYAQISGKSLEVTVFLN
jgi:hypothetical protein